jgi:hypothetical protein
MTPYKILAVVLFSFGACFLGMLLALIWNGDL